LEIRDIMGVTGEVGFASLPNAHSAYSMGMLTPAYNTKEGTAYMESSGFFPDWAVLPKKEDRRIIVPNSGSGYMVSVYQKKGWWDEEMREPRVLSVSDLALDGLVAHELVHWRKDIKDNLPRSVKSVLKRREKDYEALVSQAQEYAKNEGGHFTDAFFEFINIHHVSTNGEADIDIIAGLFGFKDGVIAKNRHMIECVKDYRNPEKSDSLYLTPAQVMRQAEFRIAEVERYC
ncbi:MAG: hypothetical protein HGA85_09155, partial [Nanoarchaeota archaeon]|nr:hypothetical protein [Nanoarchaeota archaeon]